MNTETVCGWLLVLAGVALIVGVIWWKVGIQTDEKTACVAAGGEYALIELGHGICLQPGILVLPTGSR